MAEDPSGWSLTESDPQVFSQLLRDLGVKGLQVDDLYSLDEEALAILKPIHALIFLFKYVGGDEGQRTAGVEVEPMDSGVWFANQVINNSCGTLAALNAVMNIPQQPSNHPGESIELGSELVFLKDFGTAMGSMDLGHTVAGHPVIRSVHNSFSQSTPFSHDPSHSPDAEKEDAYHFVAYLPVNGILYELDGLREKPLMHAAVEDNWLDQARETINTRIETYPPGSLMFNLLAVRSDPIPRFTRLIGDTSTPAHERINMEEQLAQEKTKAQRGSVENSLRRNNLLPAVFAMFKAMGESGMMDKAMESAGEKAKLRSEKQKANKEGDES